MMKKVLLVFAVLFVLIAGLIFFQTVIKGNSFFAKSAELSVDDTRIKLEVADTPEKRQLGLSNRDSLPEDKGMIFIFEKPDYHSFWMKDMRFPLDIIFVNDREVVTIYDNVPPMTAGAENVFYTPSEPVNRVIELNAGQAKKYKIEPGATLNLKL